MLRRNGQGRRLAPDWMLVGLATTTLCALGILVWLKWDEWSALTADIVLNVAFLCLGLLAALLLGQRWLDQNEQLRWQKVEQAIQQRATEAALHVVGGFVDAPAVQRSLRDQPSYLQMAADPSLALKFCEEQVAPTVSELASRPRPPYAMDFLNLSGQDWDAMHRGIARSIFQLARAIVLFGERPSPELQEAILRLEEAQNRYVGELSHWGPGRSGQGEMFYQKARIDRLAEVMDAAMGVLRALAAAGRPPT